MCVVMACVGQLEQVKEVGQHRRVLEVEKEDTEERRQKRKVSLSSARLCLCEFCCCVYRHM